MSICLTAFERIGSFGRYLLCYIDSSIRAIFAMRISVSRNGSGCLLTQYFLFKRALVRLGGGSEKEGKTRLKILLGDKYNEFDNLVAAIGDATIPIKGTTNPSGTAYKMLNFMTRVGSVGTFGADTVVSIANKAKDAATARRVLRRLEQSTPEKVKQAVKTNDEMVDAYIRLGLTGTLRDQ